MTQLRVRPLVGALTVVAAWSGAQFWLSHHAVTQLFAAHNSPVPDHVWVHMGVESTAALVLVAVLAAAVIVGGQRWWALVLVAFPAANLLGWFNEGRLLGLGWNSPILAIPDRWAIGIAVDTVVVVAIVVFLIRALPVPREQQTAGAGVIRAIPIAIVLTGWWLVRHSMPDATDRVWIVQAVGFVLVAALLAGSSLAVVPRLVAIVVVLPLCSWSVLDGLIGQSDVSFDSADFPRHLLFAAAVWLYVGGMPVLHRRLRGVEPVVNEVVEVAAGPAV